MLTRKFEKLKLKNTISSLLGVKLKKYLRLIFLQLDHQTLSACLKNRVEKKIGKKAYCVGPELNYFTVKSHTRMFTSLKTWRLSHIKAPANFLFFYYIVQDMTREKQAEHKVLKRL